MTKKTDSIVKHKTFKDSEGVSLKIARFVQYFKASFGVRYSFAAQSACDFNIESKSNNMLLINVAVNHIEIPFSKTKSKADSDENTM